MFNWMMVWGRGNGHHITFGMLLLWVDFDPFFPASPTVWDGVSCLSVVNDDNEKMESLKFEIRVDHLVIETNLGKNPRIRVSTYLFK